MTVDLDAAKREVCSAIDAWSDRLTSLSRDLHAHPELCFEEHHAHAVLTGLLAEAGWTPTRHAGGLDTAFVAEAGATNGPVVSVCAEYDALPGIGHACGHNVIAAAALGATIGAGAVAEDLGGRIRLIGCPAEEGGAGKVLLLDAGVFDGSVAALMVHPAGSDLPAMDVIAVSQVEATYTGRASHAAAAPERGRNALDAAVLGYMNVAALRQHIGERERVHGVFTDGGDKPNIVPAAAQSLWYVRSPDLAGLAVLEERVVACLEAGATAAGCTLTWRYPNPTTSEMWHSETILEAWSANSTVLGRPLGDPAQPATPRVSGSTDMGNVSHLFPSIHPMIAVSPADVSIHTPEFAHHAGSDRGDAAALDGAKALAMTVVDLWAHPEMRDAAAAELAVRRSRASPPGA